MVLIIMYDLAVNELLGWSCTALEPNLLKFFEVRMLIVTALILDSSDGINKTDFASSPLLIAWLPLVLPVEDSTGYDRNARHTGGGCQHGRAAVGTELAMYNFASFCVSIIELFQQLFTGRPLEMLTLVSRVSVH